MDTKTPNTWDAEAGGSGKARAYLFIKKKGKKGSRKAKEGKGKRRREKLISLTNLGFPPNFSY